MSGIARLGSNAAVLHTSEVAVLTASTPACQSCMTDGLSRCAQVWYQVLRCRSCRSRLSAEKVRLGRPGDSRHHAATQINNATPMQPHLVVATIVHCMPIQRSLGIGGADVIWELHQRLQVTGQHNFSLLEIGCEVRSAFVCMLPRCLEVTSLSAQAFKLRSEASNLVWGPAVDWPMHDSMCSCGCLA